MKKNIKKKLFVGRPFPDAMMDEQKSFTELINKWKMMKFSKNF